LLHPLTASWNRDETYFFGWGVPLLALYLFHERWRDRPEPRPALSRPSAFCAVDLILILWAFVFLATRLMLETEPDSRPVLWLDASLLVGAALGGVGLAGGRPWVRHFAFPIAFLLVGVPWVFRWEFAVTQGLMRLNAAAVARTLELFNLPARAAGNTILLPGGQLGINEACCGIRSLQATLMVSLFLGELYRFGTRRRVVIVLLGVSLALTGNYLRMLYLAWGGVIAGMASVEADHDPAGLAVLAFTLGSLGSICFALDRWKKRPGQTRSTSWVHVTPASPLSRHWVAGILAATLFAEIVTQGWYGWREKSAPHFPEWTVAWPTDAPEFHSLPIPPETRAELHDDDAGAAAWHDDAGWKWTGLWFHYRAGAADKNIFAAHNPELCLTAAGWRETEDHAGLIFTTRQLRLSAHRYRFESPDGPRYVLWIPYLDRGAAPYDAQATGLYGHTLAAGAAGRFPILSDVWHGCRGAEAETLEITVAGPKNDAEADRAFRRLVPALVRPAPPHSRNLAGP
jgi:exosortase